MGCWADSGDYSYRLVFFYILWMFNLTVCLTFSNDSSKSNIFYKNMNKVIKKEGFYQFLSNNHLGH